METYQRVERVLDERALAWTAMYTDSCEATSVRGEQSPELLDLRTACLDRRRDEMKALTTLFTSGPDGDVLDRSVQAALALPDLSACADASALTAATPLPGDGPTRARVEAVRASLDQATALDAAGKYPESAAAALPLVVEARAIGYAPLEAEALSVLGRAQRDGQDSKPAEETLREAARVAARAKDDVRAADAWLREARASGRESLAVRARREVTLSPGAVTRRARGGPGAPP